jgi:hypothetical protein
MIPSLLRGKAKVDWRNIAITLIDRVVEIADVTNNPLAIAEVLYA